MPYDIRIVRGREFVQLDAQGHFDLPASQRLFCDVIWACVHSRIGHILVDMRDATTDMTAAQLCSLASVCRDISCPGDEHKIAILNRPRTDFDRAAMLAELARGEGWNISAFREFEDAFNWLIV